MSSPPDPCPGDETLPARVDVAVIGGGIIGVCTALELAERGVSVALCEKGIVAGEQSSRNWGWCRQSNRDPREIPLAVESMKLWRGMNERVGAETGFRQCGIAYLAETEAELASRQAWFDANAVAFGLDTRILSAAETAALLPGSTVAWKGALYTASDGRAEPQKAAPAIAAAARRRGATVLTGCAVRGVEVAAGRVSAIVTERGSIACSAAVLAGGAWSRRFCGNLAIHLPQLTVVNSAQRTHPIETGLATTAAGARFAFRKRLDGGYTVTHQHLSIADLVPDSFALAKVFLPALRLDWAGLRLRIGRRFLDEMRLPRLWRLDQVSPFERVRILDPEPSDAILDEATAALKRVFPAFAGLTVAGRWAGCIDATPDAVPVIDQVEDLPGLWLATGFSGHGFGIGPGAGRLVADLVTGAPPLVDAAPFRYSRFVDGTRLAPVP